MSNLQNSIIKF
jgi:NhaP-type Na+/H+ or K+/H+ antiporter